MEAVALKSVAARKQAPQKRQPKTRRTPKAPTPRRASFPAASAQPTTPLPGVPDAEVLAAVGHATWLDSIADGTAQEPGGDTQAQYALLWRATQRDPAGTVATINLLLDALRRRHREDSNTLALLSAVQFDLLPDLLEESRGA